MSSSPGCSADKDLDALFERRDHLAQCIPGYRPRALQREMAALIAEAIEQRQHLMLEAPAGSGKTLAYLLALLRQSGKLLISTASHQLQQQLCSRDIPAAQRALGDQRRVAMLKGRANYLCPYYLEKRLQMRFLPADSEWQYRAVAQRFNTAGSGDLDQLLSGLDGQLKRHLSCDIGDCLGADCPQRQRCPLLQAQQRAQTAEIVVVNHSLLLSAQQLDGDGLPALLGQPSVVLIDEAHRLLEYSSRRAGLRLSGYRLRRLLVELVAALRADAPDQAHIVDYCNALLARLQAAAQRRIHSAPPAQQRELIARLAGDINRLLRPMPWLAARAQRLRELFIRLQRSAQLLQLMLDSEGLCGLFLPAGAGQSALDIVYTPLLPTQPVRQWLAASQGSWIFCSATLSVAGDISSFATAAGLPGTAYRELPGDLDYHTNALLYLPSINCLPQDRDYPTQFVAMLAALLPCIAGRVLLLFSSYRALQQCAALLRECTPRPLLVQGSMENQQLVQRFAQCDNALLLGTGTFWEGVDLSTAALACVVVDKLPFASPDDALLSWRQAYLAQFGIDAFRQQQLPAAIVKLRQGVGRLLRRPGDRGVVVLADPRLRQRDYGALFLASLPPMPQTQSLADIEKFFRGSNIGNTHSGN